jgi:lipoprotein-releasing system permease protein
MNSFEAFIARRYLWAQRRNLHSAVISLFSACGVTLGTWLLIFVLSAINGFENEVKRQLIGKDAHVEITQRGFQPVGDYLGLLEKVRTESEVVAAAPFIVGKTVITHGKSQDGIVVYGIEAEASRQVIGLSQTMAQGEYQFESVADSGGVLRPGVVLGLGLAYRLGAQVGDKVFMADFTSAGDMSSGNFAPRIVTFVVTGIFESGMYQYDETLAYIDLKQAQKLFGLENQVTGVQIRIQDPYQSGLFAEKIEEKLGFPLHAVDWQMKNQTLIKWMAYEKVLVGLALGIIIIIAAFNIISSLVMAVNDKVREIGILRAMGATRGSILRIFMLEGSLIGVGGSMLGLVLGLASYFLQKEFGLIQLPGDVYFVTQLPVELHFWDVVLVMLITNLLCSLATILPALKASRHDPVEAIRHE